MDITTNKEVMGKIMNKVLIIFAALFASFSLLRTHKGLGGIDLDTQIKNAGFPVKMDGIKILTPTVQEMDKQTGKIYYNLNEKDEWCASKSMSNAPAYTAPCDTTPERAAEQMYLFFKQNNLTKEVYE